MRTMTGIRCTLMSEFSDSKISLTAPISTPLNLTGAPTRSPLTELSK
jgi:hypothetical protein